MIRITLTQAVVSASSTTQPVHETNDALGVMSTTKAPKYGKTAIPAPPTSVDNTTESTNTTESFIKNMNTTLLQREENVITPATETPEQKQKQIENLTNQILDLIVANESYQEEINKYKKLHFSQQIVDKIVFEDKSLTDIDVPLAQVSFEDAETVQKLLNDLRVAHGKSPITTKQLNFALAEGLKPVDIPPPQSKIDSSTADESHPDTALAWRDAELKMMSKVAGTNDDSVPFLDKIEGVERKQKDVGPPALVDDDNDGPPELLDYEIDDVSAMEKPHAVNHASSWEVNAYEKKIFGNEGDDSKTIIHREVMLVLFFLIFAISATTCHFIYRAIIKRKRIAEANWATEEIKEALTKHRNHKENGFELNDCESDALNNKEAVTSFKC